MHRTAGVLGACLLAATVLGNLMAQEAVKKSHPATAASEDHSAAQIAEEIRQKLHDPISLQLKDVPIRDAIEQLLTKPKVDLWFDQELLSEGTLDGIEITCNMNNVSIRAALKRILSQAKLSWVCEDTGIRITTAEKAIQSPFARVYDIADLIEEPPTVEVVVPQGIPGQAAQFGGGGVPPSSPLNDGTGQTHADKTASQPRQKLINLIMQLTGGPPNGPWLDADGEGGSVHVFETTLTKLLVIRQTEQVHADIEDLLNELLSHHHQADEDMEAASGPKNAARVKTRSPAKIVVRRRSALNLGEKE